MTDYDDRRERLRSSFEQRDGQQPGDPVKLAQALVDPTYEPAPPMRFIAGSVAVNAAGAKLTGMKTELERWRPLSVATDGDYAAWQFVGSPVSLSFHCASRRTSPRTRPR